MKKMKCLWVLFCVALLVVSVLSGVQTLGFSGDDRDDQIALVRIEDMTDRFHLRSIGISILETYPDQLLVEIDEREKDRLVSSGFEVRELSDRTRLSVKSHTFDIEDGGPELSEDLTIDGYEAGHEGLYLVHMLGPVHPEWRDTLERKGVVIINYVPNYAYEVSMTPEKAEDVERLDFVDWVGIYQPGFKLAEDLETGRVKISLVGELSGETLDSIESKVDVLSVSTRPDTGDRVRAEIEDEDVLNEIARMDEVYHISNPTEEEPKDEMQTQITGGGLWFWDPEDDPDSAFRLDESEGEPPYAGNAGSYVNQLGYTGKGVQIAIADSGIDDDHEDFQDRVVGGYSYVDGEDWRDRGDWGHGTHVTGSAAADTFHGTGQTVYEDYYSGQGAAPQAELFAVRVFDEDGSNHFPEDRYEVIEPAKQEGDAYIHSNSYAGTTEGAYDERAGRFDKAARDANRDTDFNEPMVLVACASNSGPDENSIDSPGTAKNVITVGATEHYSPNTRGGDDNPDKVSLLSSRGWTDDNRIKPDVMAPGGEDVTSTMPGGGYDEKFGTSMSAPVVAGDATVTVEWYEEHYGERPSPAMVRALLINTATDLDRSANRPNRDVGWGMSNLVDLIDSDVDFMMHDQTSDLETGQQDEYDLEVDDTSEPLKVTLTWTDKEAQEGDQWTLKNDINLEVESPSGEIYKGNAFSEDGGDESTTGYSFPDTDTMEYFDRDGDGTDDVNNVENVFIHPDYIESGTYTARVIGENIPEDANNDGQANQDYALVGQNVLGAVPPYIELENPGGGETWSQGETETIEWTTEEGDAAIDSVDLEYSTDGGWSYTDIETGLSDTGSYTWEVPEEGSDEARIRSTVHDVDSLSYSDVSDPFDIAPHVEVTSPEKGERWTEGEEEIEWETIEGINTIIGVDLEYSIDGGSTWTDIETGLADKGSYSWEVPDEETENAKILATVEDDAGHTDSDMSDPFSIGSGGPLPPTDPDPAEGATSISIDPDLSVHVEHDFEEDVDVSFYDDSDDSLICTEDDVQSGERAQIVWEDLEYDSTYEWYAVADDGDETATSSTWSFSTREAGAPSIEITSPEWGDTWIIGDEEEIRWTTEEGDGEITGVDLEYSGDDGTSWGEIATGIEDDGIYTEPVPDESTEEARIRATVHCDQGLSGEDTSGTFQIKEEVEEYELTINTDGQGMTDPDEGTHTYFKGEEVMVEATPEEGWYFVEWTGDETSIESTIDLTMDEDKSITAVFEEETGEYELTIDIEGEGTTDPSTGTHAYEDGEVVTVSATPDEGWDFVEWTGDESGIDPTIEITMDEDKSVTAIFEEEPAIIEYELTINVEGEGSTDPEEGTYTYEEGEVVPVSATPEEGWYFGEWTGAHESEGEEIEITMDSDKEITAHFETDLETYDLTIEVEGQGTTDPEEGTHEYAEGTEVTVTADAGEDWYFEEWTGDYEEMEEEIEITMDSDKEIIAHFELDGTGETYDLTINIEGQGTTDPEPGEHTYVEDEDVTVTATAEEGWFFVEWTGDHESTEEEITITMDSDQEMTAHFKEEKANFEVEIIGYEENVTEGEDVTIRFRVTNVGGVEESRFITLYSDGEQLEVYGEVVLGPGEKYVGEFILELEEVGEHEFAVDSSDSQESININVMGDDTEDDDSTFVSEYWWLIGVLLIGAIIAVVLVSVLVMKEEEPKEKEKERQREKEEGTPYGFS